METPKLYTDLYFEILSRTELKDLDRFKSVCKEWNHIPQEPSFKPLHGERTNSISGYLVQKKKPLGYDNSFVSMDGSTRISLDFLPWSLKVHTRIVATTRPGILCCVSDEHKKNRFYVCKPSTQEWRLLPNPKMKYFTEKVAMSVLGTDTLHYKIVRLSRPRTWLIENNNFRCDIFDSNTWRWKKLTDILVPKDAFLGNQYAVVARGSIFWLLTNKTVLNFDVITETYTIFSLPEFQEVEMPYRNTNKLIEYKGRLAFLSQAQDLNMWILEDFNNHVWGPKRTMSLQAVLEIDRHATCIGFSDADNPVMAAFSSLISYDFRDSSMRKVKTEIGFLNQHDIFLLRSDSETINLSRQVPKI